MLLGALKNETDFPGNDLFWLTSLFRIALQRAIGLVREPEKGIQTCILDTWKVGTATVFSATVLMAKFLMKPNTRLGDPVLKKSHKGTTEFKILTGDMSLRLDIITIKKSLNGSRIFRSG